MSKELLPIGTRVACRFFIVSTPIIGTIIEIHEDKQYYKVNISRTEIEKARIRGSYHWREWEANRGQIWVSKGIIQQACKLNRHGAGI